mmetsp:Transcript_57535/g.136864  ORF Transcript_57535/g.136864 Transcript_57535/m.136864 type:complete len:233 (-) Transcript_57535:23-721(-)
MDDVPPSTDVIMRLPGNERCFDCEGDCSSHPWASLTHGTVICIACAGIHRSLGVHISFVRSLLLDTLSEKEVDLLMSSGNARFEQFLASEDHGVPRTVWLEVPLATRYFTPVADLYRRRLRAEQTEEDAPEELKPIKPPLPTSGSASSRRAPHEEGKWTPDDQALSCELCHARFSWRTWRHHCRRCGRCICAECSPHECWQPLPARGHTEAVRHCKRCVLPAARPMEGLSVQ